MVFERSFISWSEGLGICCWSSPSKTALAKLFDDAGTPYEKMLEVEEHAGPESHS
jgi:hypothetical protein